MTIFTDGKREGKSVLTSREQQNKKHVNKMYKSAILVYFSSQYLNDYQKYLHVGVVQPRSPYLGKFCYFAFVQSGLHQECLLNMCSNMARRNILNFGIFNV